MLQFVVVPIFGDAFLLPRPPQWLWRDESLSSAAEKRMLFAKRTSAYAPRLD
jgi:hypothetical protein